MSIIVEDGTAKVDSETYISVTDADTFFANRGFSLWATLSTAEKEQALRRATDYLEFTYRTRWNGVQVNSTQALGWPRINVPHPSGVGLYPSISIPPEVIKANAELAYRAAGGELLGDVKAPVLSETVGPISVTYDRAAVRVTRYPVVDRLLAPLLFGMGNSSLLRS